MEGLLKEIKSDLQADVVAVAEWKKKEASIQWGYATGMNNKRYRHMHILYGLGIVGKVMQSGTPMYYLTKEETGKDPLVNAESLESLLLIPIPSGSSLSSVLLIGYRVRVDLPQEAAWKKWQERVTEALKGE
ncbi:hypothetical protein [Salimicrobium flavidum]|uniref:Nitrogen regulatory protein A n=1 Tax=Salimicrobium flavidum TaxID=570947 RepID=A0A1N7IT33_9BACI|nr:hypothetical protein [Salimicrobium flavidum]SIS40187.1 nitrogen regulatory protein A [Salimicrobium flavidum]